MYILFQTNAIKKGILKYAEGIKIKHANKAINGLNLILPSIEEQKEYVKIIKLQDNVIEDIINIIQLKQKIFNTTCINITK
jgi:hypothetical protein